MRELIRKLLTICCSVFLFSIFMLAIKIDEHSLRLTAFAIEREADCQKVNPCNIAEGEKYENLLTVGKESNLTNAHYINNAKYFLNNPKHKANDGTDNPIGTCTTVAMEMMLGYHNYYTDRRLIPSVANDGTVFLSENYGLLEYDPKVCDQEDIGTIGLQDTVYAKIFEMTTGADSKIGQNFLFVNNGTKRFLSEYSPIADRVDINFGLTYNKQEVLLELDSNRPVTLGTITQKTNSSNEEEKSYHVVVAYGYGDYNSQFGYICHMGWGSGYVKCWIPENYFHFQNIVRVNHNHTLVDQQVNIKNAYRQFKCSECGCDILDDLYEVSADGNTIISLKYDPLPDTVLPKIINGKNITGVAKNVFKGTSISSIDLGKCTYLGEGVFENCTLLSEVVFPNGLTMTCIPDNCFKGCSNLSMITLPSTVTNIGRAAFEDCSKLTSIGNIINLVNIGAFAFRNCTNLSSFTGYAKLSSIGQGAFAGCNECTINILGNTSFCSENNIIYNEDKTVIFGSGKVNSVLDLSSVQTIMGSAFENNTGIQKVYIKQINIEDRAFYGCANITEVYFDGFSMAELGRDCFTNDSFIAYVPYFMQSSYQYALSTYTDNIVSRQFCVTYFSDGVQKDVTTNYYGEIVSNMPIVNRNGYTFDGWYKA